MRLVHRSLALAATLAGGLVLAAPALAAYTPRFVLGNPSERLGGGGPVTLNVEISKDDDATFQIVFYIPQGYGAELGQAPGTQVGTLTGQVNARAISPDAIVPVTGTVVAADPAPYRTMPGTIACNAGNTTFDAVLELRVSAAGQSITVPSYVFLIRSGPEASFAAAKLVVCFGNPNVPEAQGGARLGIKVTQAALTFTDVFVNPITGGNYAWRSLWVPWGPLAPNVAGLVEAQSIDAIPAQLTATGSFSRNRSRLTVRGTLTESEAAVGGANVQILVGKTRTSQSRLATVRTTANGAYRVTVRPPNRLLTGRFVFVRTRTTVPTRTVPCVSPVGTHTCVSSNRSGFSMLSSVVRVRIR